MKKTISIRWHGAHSAVSLGSTAVRNRAVRPEGGRILLSPYQFYTFPLTLSHAFGLIVLLRYSLCMCCLRRPFLSGFNLETIPVLLLALVLLTSSAVLFSTSRQ